MGKVVEHLIIAPLNGLSSMNINANYGKSVPPVRASKKIDFEDAMVVPVEESQETSQTAQVSNVKAAQNTKMQKAYNEIASGMQEQNTYYDAAMQGGTYSMVGSMFDVAV